LMVKLQFNEQENTLTVSVISYRTLFAFWDNTPYKGTVGCGRKIRCDRLPYLVVSNPQDRFFLGKAYKKSLPRPRRHYVFRKWIEYEGLQPQEKELTMVNDYIELTFDIQNKRNNVTVRLRDLMFLDAVCQKGISTRYELSYGKDLDTEYQIAIHRNPCFGLDEELSAAQNSLAAIAKSYTTFKKRYGKGSVGTEEALKAFQELRATLVDQFPRNETASPCPDISQLRHQYNLLADSIASLNVVVAAPQPIVEGIFDAKERAKNARVILANARQIDNIVARWLGSSDETERADLANQCLGIIKDTNVIIKSVGGRLTTEEGTAVGIFRQAEKYFNRTCR